MNSFLHTVRHIVPGASRGPYPLYHEYIRMEVELIHVGIG